MVATLPNGSHLVKWQLVTHFTKWLDHLIIWLDHLVRWLSFTNWVQHIHQLG